MLRLFKSSVILHHFVKGSSVLERFASTLCVPQTLEQNQAYTDEEMREFEEHLAQQEQDLNLKAVDLQKQRDELERQQEQLNAQKIELQQVMKGTLLYFSWGHGLLQ